VKTSPEIAVAITTLLERRKYMTTEPIIGPARLPVERVSNRAFQIRSCRSMRVPRSSGGDCSSRRASALSWSSLSVSSQPMQASAIEIPRLS